MNELIKLVLLSNSSQLGFNWIYNREFLKQYSKTNNMLMTKPINKHYEENKPSYNTYEGYEIGENTLQGQIVSCLYNDMINNDLYNEHSYEKLLLNHFLPGGIYKGYVESYGNKLVVKYLNKRLKINNEISLDDDQLVGFVPYVVYKALNKSSSDALKLTNVLTNNEDYKYLFDILDNVNKENIKEVLTRSKLSFKNKILNAIKYEDDTFIKDVHELSCSIDVAFPIIFYLYNKHKSLIEALNENVILGGASGDRAIILALLYHPDKLPKEWDKYI